MSPRPLNPASLPLHGSRLIEASAGTGKTWTIAALYLRLVLGHGGDAAFGRPLQPAEILVMTFTVAATRELSDRIRRRLVEAAQAFRADDSAGDDALLAELMAAYPDGAARRHAAWRLEMAAQAMDDAAVHTIDAWCQRMLREHAFDSGCLFDEELSPDESVIRREAAHDYWRLQVYPLRGVALDAVLDVWPDATRLADEIWQLVEQPWPAEAGDGSLGGLLERLMTRRDAELAQLKAGWSERATRMSGWLASQLDSPACPFNKSKLRRDYVESWLSALQQWADEPALERPEMGKGRQRLTPDGLLDALKAGQAIDPPPDFAAFDDAMTALDARQPLSVALRPHAAVRVAARIAELKQQAGRFGFADMLERLDRALDPALNGAGAQRLRQHIVERYPAALIDEFQDTSPVQLRIFDRLYRIADNDPSTALLLIGDPKQSIYRFRGADIHSYLDARRKTQGRHHLLTTNHRSTAALVAAVNHLFDQAETRVYPTEPMASTQGAFMYGGRVPSATVSAAGAAAAAARPAPQGPPADGAGSVERDTRPVPFIAVGARGRPDRLRTSTGITPALQLVFESGVGDASGIRRRFAQRCAEQIATSLNDPQAGFDDPASQTFIRLRPADIAVLVRTGREAQAVRRELQRRRVASVYLSDQDSVFASAEAADLLHWLRAVAQPLDTRLVRAALATRLIGLPISELRRLASDDEAFDERSELIARLHTVWQTQGVLTMLRRSLHQFELPARWLAEGALPAGADADESAGAGRSGPVVEDGERRLTNFLHLAELLQAASANLDGEQALIRWLAAQVDDAAVARDDEQIVRLESDADLVQVITVHKSKGLEYPLVFLPFASGFRPVEKGRNLLFVDLVDPASGERQIHLDPTSEQIVAADLDRQREDLRLLYVALTRARYSVWVGLAAQSVGKHGNNWHRSAAGRLLGDGQPVDAAQLPGQLAALVCDCAAIDLMVVSGDAAVECTVLSRRGRQPALSEPPDYAADFERTWRIASFSAMVRDLPAVVSKMAADAQQHDDETVVADSAGGADADTTSPNPARRADDTDRPVMPATADLFADEPWHTFPRGSVPGNFLHGQLEWLASERFDLTSSERQQQLLRRCERQGWGHRGQAVLDWLGVLSRTPLPGLDTSLAAIDGVLMPEMEFWFGSDGVEVELIDALCRSHLLRGRDRPALPRRELNGMLMGFADLVFEHAGRYWVLDYKSNWLGDGDAAYSPDALEAAMASHRYDVQAAIYLLALHRLLRSRLGSAYDPARQLGGAVYCFLRGINGPTRGCHLIGPSVELLDGLDGLLGSPVQDHP